MTSRFFLPFVFQAYLGLNFVTSQYIPPTGAVIHVSPREGLEGPPGRQYAIKCRASWYRTAPDIEWTFNGRPIYEGNKYTIDIEQTPLEDMTISFLFIQNARPEDSGRYGCRMQQPAFGLASTTFKVYSQPVLMPSPHQLIDRDTNMTLRCPARGNFGGNLFWLKDNIVIGGQAGMYDWNSDRILDYWVMDNQRMMILNANIQHAGVYTCQYRYFLNGMHRNVAEYIHVNSPVELVTAPLIRYQEFPNSGPLRLECKARGFPRPRIAWTYSNFTFEAGGHMDRNVSIVTSPQSQTIVTSVLSVRHMPDKFNVARFNCSGRNGISKASKLIMVVNMGAGQTPNQGPNTGTSTSDAATGSASSFVLIVIVTSYILMKSLWDTR